MRSKLYDFNLTDFFNVVDKVKLDVRIGDIVTAHNKNLKLLGQRDFVLLGENRGQ